MTCLPPGFDWMVGAGTSDDALDTALASAATPVGRQPRDRGLEI
jgi:hypothetical protein